jgi:hypothetical protein
MRRLLAAFNKRDWGAFSAELDPEVQYMPVEEHAVYRGPEAVSQYTQRWLEAWDTFSVAGNRITKRNAPPSAQADFLHRLPGITRDYRGFGQLSAQGGAHARPTQDSVVVQGGARRSPPMSGARMQAWRVWLLWRRARVPVCGDPYAVRARKA